MHASTRHDYALVTMVANRRSVSEFELFRAAYRAWYGVEGRERLVERHFGDYLNSGRAPHWVRHHCRASRQESSPDRRVGHEAAIMPWRPLATRSLRRVSETAFTLLA